MCQGADKYAERIQELQTAEAQIKAGDEASARGDYASALGVYSEAVKVLLTRALQSSQCLCCRFIIFPLALVRTAQVVTSSAELRMARAKVFMALGQSGEAAGDIM